MANTASLALNGGLVKVSATRVQSIATRLEAGGRRVVMKLKFINLYLLCHRVDKLKLAHDMGAHCSFKQTRNLIRTERDLSIMKHRTVSMGHSLWRVSQQPPHALPIISTHRLTLVGPVAMTLEPPAFDLGRRNEGGRAITDGAGRHNKLNTLHTAVPVIPERAPAPHWSPSE